MHEEIVWKQGQLKGHFAIMTPLTDDTRYRKKVLYVSFGIVLGHSLLMVRTSEDREPPALLFYAVGNHVRHSGRYNINRLRSHQPSRIGLVWWQGIASLLPL